MDLVIGTAGHIDHGKTSLIRALTGKDADRLPEEKARGITIDLGFAELERGETRIGFVDVPGHERFVRNMLAGATGIDAVLLIVAADEGVMPQTREHLEICSLLRIPKGIVVITKIDLVDSDWLGVVEEELEGFLRGGFLENAPRVKVSSKTGEGVEGLIKEIETISETLNRPESNGITRLPIDRSFSMKGFGAVVTGTLSGGIISVGDDLLLFPSNTPVRARGIQIHGVAVEKTSGSQRTAINLSGIDFKEIERGDTLIEKDAKLGATIVDAFVEVLDSSPVDLRSKQKVKVHHGASEVLAKVYVVGDQEFISPGEKSWVQLRLERPLAAIPSDRFVLRSFSPQCTVGGGEIVRINPPKYRTRECFLRSNSLERFKASDDLEKVVIVSEERGLSGFSIETIQFECGWPKKKASVIVEGLLKSGVVSGDPSFFINTSILNLCISSVKVFFEDYLKSNRHSPGVPLSALRARFKDYPDELISMVVGSISNEGAYDLNGDSMAPKGHSLKLSEKEEGVLRSISNRVETAGLEGLRREELKSSIDVDENCFNEMVSILLQSKSVVLISNEFLFSGKAINDLKDLVWGFAENGSDRVIDVSIFKSLTGLSRKYAIPLLEYLDQEKVTVRSGDKRVVIRKTL